MLPRTQWQNLVHLDTIKARNKPVEPPKKPDAAPFFLPTVAGADAGRNPVFDFGAGEEAAAADPAAEAALAAKAAAAWGEGEEAEEERPQDGAADAAGSSDSEQEGGGAARRQRPQVGRVLRSHAQAEHSHLVRLLHSCARAGDWASLVAHLRALPPVAVDAEIRAMQVGATLWGLPGAAGPGSRRSRWPPPHGAHLAWPRPPPISSPRCWRALQSRSWRT